MVFDNNTRVENDYRREFRGKSGILFKEHAHHTFPVGQTAGFWTSISPPETTLDHTLEDACCRSFLYECADLRTDGCDPLPLIWEARIDKAFFYCGSI